MPRHHLSLRHGACHVMAYGVLPAGSSVLVSFHVSSLSLCMLRVALARVMLLDESSLLASRLSRMVSLLSSHCVSSRVAPSPFVSRCVVSCRVVSRVILRIVLSFLVSRGLLVSTVSAVRRAPVSRRTAEEVVCTWWSSFQLRAQRPSALASATTKRTIARRSTPDHRSSSHLYVQPGRKPNV